MKNKGKKSYLSTAKRLLTYIMKGYKLQFIAVIITIIISAFSSTAGTLFLRYLIDSYITPLIGSGTTDFSGLINIILFMAAIYYFGVISTYIYGRLMAVISQSVLKDIRDELFEHMQRLPISYFDTHATGDIMSHYTNDVDALRQMISQGFPQCLSSIVTIAGILIAMIAIDIPMTIFMLLIMGIMVFTVKTIGAKSGKYFMLQQRKLGDVNGYIEEMIEGQKVIKVFCHEEAIIQEFNEKNESLSDSYSKANGYASVIMPILGNFGNMAYLLVAVVGSIFSITGLIPLSLGSLASFIQFTKSMTQPIMQVSQQINSIILALAGAGRIFDLLDEEVETNDGYVTLVNAKEENGTLIEVNDRTGTWAWKYPQKAGESVKLTKVTGDVRFENVNFGYTEKKTILKNINLFAKPGQKIAFVGSTGAGKTTITNLINRFYDIQNGKITFDGIDIKKIRKDDLRRSLGIVLQDTHLFTGTIKDNIRYGKLDATDEEIYAAARLTNADSFIKYLPNGYDTVISGDGGSLSQGQRQLIAIARAAVANPPVLILDEATSSIDTRTEAIVQSGMDKLMHGRTVFVIAHRLSTVRNSDAIMVLEHGEIIERGNHNELIKENGKYYQLYTGAFELS